MSILPIQGLGNFSVPPKLLRSNMITGDRCYLVYHFKTWIYPDRGSEPLFASRSERKNGPKGFGIQLAAVSLIFSVALILIIVGPRFIYVMARVV